MKKFLCDFCVIGEMVNDLGTESDYFLSLLTNFSPQGSVLTQQYEELYLKSRDFDGRLFYDGDETVLSPAVKM